MHRWQLAAGACILGIGLLIARSSDSMAQPQTEQQTPQLLQIAALPAATGETNAPPAISRSAPTDGSTAQDGSFQSQIDGWIRTLAEQQTEFQSWKDAAWTRYPLGAGMHGWIVLLHKNGKELGYMIVGATEDGKLSLTEYGAGDNPLFSMQTLYRSLVQLELIHSDQQSGLTLREDAPAGRSPYDELLAHESRVERLYYSPLHAVWKWTQQNEDVYLDARTGEQLPLTAQQFNPLQPYDPRSGLPAAMPPLEKSLTLASFDPFANMHWIFDSPLPIRSATSFIEALADGSLPITFTANLYGRKVLMPYAVTGYNQWKLGSTYVKIEQQGGRYVPFDTLLQYGSFFRQGSGA
jgi:hypothetical protein